MLQVHRMYRKEAKLVPQSRRRAAPTLLQVLLAEHARMKEVRERREAEKKEREEKRMAELRWVGHGAVIGLQLVRSRCQGCSQLKTP